MGPSVWIRIRFIPVQLLSWVLVAQLLVLQSGGPESGPLCAFDCVYWLGLGQAAVRFSSLQVWLERMVIGLTARKLLVAGAAIIQRVRRSSRRQGRLLNGA